jgi:hypothetical protein
MSELLWHDLEPVLPVPWLNCPPKNYFRMSSPAPHGVGAVQGVARSISGRLGLPGRRGDTGDGGHVRPSGV